MSPNSIRLSRVLTSAWLALLLGCTAEDRLAPGEPAVPPPNLAPYAFQLNIDVVHGTVQVASAGTSGSQAGHMVANSLAGADIISLTTSNVYRSPIVSTKRTITFDLTLTNRLSVTDLVTPTFPLPPPGVQGIIAFPYTVAAYGVQGGKATANTDWDGDGTAGSGKPFNFFNDFGTCGTSATSDCYRWERFANALPPGQTTPPHKVGFTVDKNVTSVSVYLVVAADLADHPPTQPAPGLGALTGTVSSLQLGALAGVTVTVAPGTASVTTDALGKYLLTGLPAGQMTATLSGLPATCITPAAAGVSITSGGVTTADISVSCPVPTGGTGSISGSVTSPLLGPLAATLSAVSSTPQPPVTGQADTTRGAYSLGSVNAGQVTVSVSGVPSFCTTPQSQTVTLATGGSATANFVVDCPVQVGGRVTSPTLGALSGVTVSTSNPSLSTQTEANGYYGISGGLVSGTTTISLSQGLQSFCTVPPAVTYSGAPRVDFSVDCNSNPTGFLQVTVTDQNGAPLDQVEVSVQGPQQQSLVGITNTSGQTSGSGLAVGAWTATVSAGLAQNCTAPPATPFTITGGTTTYLVLQATCTYSFVPMVVGQVSSPTLGALDGVTVQLSVMGRGAFSTQTSGGGNFQFDTSICGSQLVCLIWLASPASLSIQAGLPASCVKPAPMSVQLFEEGSTVVEQIVVDCS